MAKTHASLTGADLHECKGVDSATENTVFVADGLGSGSFQKIPAAALATAVNAFSSQYFQVQEQSGSISLATGDNIRRLSIIKENGFGATVSDYKVTLPVGSYYIEAEASQNGANGDYYLTWFNTTTRLNQVRGLSNAGDSETFTSVTAILRGRFTIVQPNVFQLIHYTSTNATGGSTAGSAISADVRIWKLS